MADHPATFLWMDMKIW